MPPRLRQLTGLLAVGVALCVLASAATAQNAKRDPRRVPVKAETPEGVRMHNDMIYANYPDRGEMLLDLFEPWRKHGDGPFPTLLVVHGGGWMKGNKEKFRPLAEELCSRGYVTAAISYKLADPDPAFPESIQDLKAAVRYLRANAERFRIDPKRIGVIGGSAGGHLAALLGVSEGVKDFEGKGGNPNESSAVQAVVVLAGPTDLTTEDVISRSRKGTANSNIYLGKKYDEDPKLYELASPLYHVDAGDPPILFMDGSNDNPGNRYLTIRPKLQAAGVPEQLIIVPDGPHGMWNMTGWFDTCVDHMDEFFKAKLK